MTEKKPQFLNIFASLVLCIVIIVAILSTISYVNIENVMSSQISGANMKNLNQISEEVNSMAKMASTISYQIYNDVTISKLLNFTNLNIYDQSLAMSQVTNYQTIFPMIDSIYIYNGNTDTFYVRSSNINVDSILNKENFYDRQALTIIENHKNFKQNIPIARRYIDSNGTLRNFYYTFIMYNDIWSKNNAVIVNINESFIQSIINEERTGGDSESFIMDAKGSIVSNSKNFPMLADMSDKDYIKHILANSSSPKYFVAGVNGVKSLIVYTSPDSFGWTYVRVFPWDSLFSTITNIKLIILGLSLAILALGVVSAFIISRQLYRPINKLISNVRNLEAEKKDNTFLMKQEFLRGLLLGSISQVKTDMDKKHDELNVKLPIGSPFHVILLKIDHFKLFLEQNGYEARAALKGAIARISTETLSVPAQMEAVDIGDDAVAIILESTCFPDGLVKDALSASLAEMQSTLLSRCGVSVSIAVSSESNSLEMMHELYNQALTASMHRLFYGHGCIVFAQDVMAFSSAGYVYPMQKEKLLTDALMEGKMDDVKKIYYDIVSETCSYPISVFNLTISHLIFTLNKTIHIITANNSITNSLDIGIPITLLSEVETIEEFNANLYAIFDRLSQSLEEKKTLKHETIVNSINEIIQAKYSASDLSISSIAEALGMSDAYICRVYKQYTVHTILDTIVNVRMQKARELLRNTTCPITTIAEKCGFANSTYFYTAFKASNGVTPSDYRKNILNEGPSLNP